MLKSAATSALDLLAKKLPKGRRTLVNALLDNMDDAGGYEVFQQLAARFGIESLSVRGWNGLMYGSSSDRGVFRLYVKDRAWARETVGLLEQFFETRGGGTYLDIGANIGLTVIPVAKNPTVQCFGFEPEPRNFSYLQQNIAVNCRYGNVSVTQLALFDRTGSVDFEIHPTRSGIHRIRAMDAPGALMQATPGTVSVMADRLDNVVHLETLRLPLVVKIDTEGAEPHVVGGGQKVLTAAELISLEFSPVSMRRIGGDVEAELGFLGANFREGSIADGDTDTAPRWRPIEAVVDDLRRLSAGTQSEDRYFDVLVRK